MRRPCLPFFAAAVAAFCPVATAQSGKDELSRVYARWIRDFKAGRIEPGDARGVMRKPYVTAKLQGRLSGRLGAYDRIREAKDLFTLLKERATKEDAARLIDVAAISLGKKGGKFWEVNGKFTRFRNALVEVLAGGCKPTIQAAIVDRVRSAFVRSDKLEHTEPELAAVFVPLLGVFGQPSFRGVLEDCLRVEHSGMQVAAARALARMGYGRSIVAVAQALNSTKYPDDVAVLAGALSKLVEAKQPAPTDRDLKFALNIVIDRMHTLKQWRARISLVPVLRRIRSRGNVPALIEFLEEGNATVGKKGKNLAYSGTLLSTVHEALVDLSGFYAGPREPQKWRSWWDSVQDTFVLAPVRKKPAKNGTAARGFFGIPVSGNRVAFVIDVSGSMAWPYEVVTGTGGRAQKGKAAWESRLERAKKELLRALDEMPPDAKFNVIFFSDHTKAWKSRLVWANRSNKKAMAGHLKRVNASGGTALYDGVNEALKIKFARKRDQPYGSSVDEVFVLSDGSPTLGKITSTQRILELVREWNAGARVRIHAIYIGDEDVDKSFAPPGSISRLPGNMKGEEFMKKLAEQNDGRFLEPNRRGGK